MNKQSFYTTIKDDAQWQAALPSFNHTTVHVAVMVEPFLSMVFAGTKTIESRFSKHRIAPYQKIKPGDVVLLKKSSGPIVGSFIAKEVNFFTINPQALEEIKEKYSAHIGADTAFWELQKSKGYATLIAISQLHKLPPKVFPKKDPRGWVMLQ